MNQSQKDVKEFHEQFGCVINEKPTVPDLNTMKLRLDLIVEELQELARDGFGMDLNDADEYVIVREPKIIDIADGLGDLLYVVYGTAVSCGIDMEPVMREIHRSNMSKVWPDGTVHRRGDGKVLKPDSYSPADLGMVLLAQM